MSGVPESLINNLGDTPTVFLTFYLSLPRSLSSWRYQ